MIYLDFQLYMIGQGLAFTFPCSFPVENPPQQKRTKTHSISARVSPVYGQFGFPSGFL